MSKQPILLGRTITLEHTENIEESDQKLHRFAGTEKLFSNKTDNPDNWCFDSHTPSGVFDTSSCRYGTPAFISFPHFYLADPYYLNQVDGLNPQKELHEFHIDLEPVQKNTSSFIMNSGFVPTKNGA